MGVVELDFWDKNGMGVGMGNGEWKRKVQCETRGSGGWFHGEEKAEGPRFCFFSGMEWEKRTIQEEENGLSSRDVR